MGVEIVVVIGFVNICGTDSYIAGMALNKRYVSVLICLRISWTHNEKELVPHPPSFAIKPRKF